MIIMKIIQGPGNQMFQYAYALAASKRIGTEFKLDLDWYNHHSDHRPYILDRFNISAPEATQEEIEYIKTKNASNFIGYRWNLLRDKLAPPHKKTVVQEDVQSVDWNLKRPHTTSYIEGYFTSEKFFNDFADDVKRELSFVGEMSDESKKTAELMQNTNSVAISFRRGDFLTKEWQNVCSLEYYQRAIMDIKKSVDNPTFFVFSDELNWVRDNINLGVEVHYMDFNYPDYMQDMRLMTHCKNHIITNSTFSWWGAWLSGSNNIICPEYWLNPNIETHKKEFNGSWVEFSHVLPKSWKRIPNLVEGDTLMPLP